MAASIFIFALILSPFSVLGGVMDPSCKPVGTKSITILWKFSPTKASKLPNKFSVYFCKNIYYNCVNTSINYHLGCAVNVTEQKSEYSCDIGKALNINFPEESSFIFYVKPDNGPPVIRRCLFNMEIQCSKPTGLKLTPFGKGTLKLHWSVPTDMGKSGGNLLCYFITYFRAESPEKKFEHKFVNEGLYEFEIKSLLPYQKYHAYLKCALSCTQKKSLAAGPAIATTLEEEPQDQVRFQNWFERKVDHQTRNVTVVFKIPNKEKWNGKVKQIRVFCYEYEHLCMNKTVRELLPDQQLQYNTTFSYLKNNTTYHVKADYCNSVGCSPTSRNQTILPSPPDAAKVEVQLEPNESLTTGKVVGISVGCIVGVFLLMIMIIVLIKKCYRNSEPHEPLEETIGPLSPTSEPREGEEAGEQANSVYSRANHLIQSNHLSPETTDFQSASVRSINSMNSIGGLTDQSTLGDDNSASIPNNEEDPNRESVRLLPRPGSPSVQHRPSHRDDNQHTRV
ncbi:uncharacterized protein LOC116305024 [Actinia tenebrosa]|uniref:Uncharacterized protein LOC116305024 n=1 Tax=Actinia tenebrosa TaxID=6105 RepID=A0A6P8ITX7_ACTTE|nr:uncharacterized protein LOC116305024 [Actinia tenebrosa]